MFCVTCCLKRVKPRPVYTYKLALRLSRFGRRFNCVYTQSVNPALVLFNGLAELANLHGPRDPNHMTTAYYIIMTLRALIQLRLAP